VALGGSQLWQLAKASAKGWVDDGAPSMGAALAFYTLFSLAPLLLVVISLAGLVVGRDVAQEALNGLLTQFAGERAAAGIAGLLAAAATGERGFAAAAISALMLVLGATTLFAELRTDLNRIWRYKPAKAGGFGRFVRTRVSAFLLVMGVGVLLLASVGLSAVLATVSEHWLAGAEAALHAGELAISFALLTGLFAMIYKLLPATRIAWGDVWIGAAVTAALFWLGKFLIALYIAHAAVGSNLGAAGAIVVLVAWVYYSSQVFFFGAEFTREYAVQHGSHQADSHLPPPATPRA
jgi:membrane protein